MKTNAADYRTVLSLSGMCCLLAVLGLMVLPAKSIARADDSDSSKSSAKQDSSSQQDKDKNQSRDSTDRDNQNRQDGRHAWIGVRLQEDGNAPTPVDHKESDRSQRGIEAMAIYPGGPAARGGLRQGDRIEKINGKDMTSAREVSEAVRGLQPGAKIEMVVFRNGNEKTLTITAGDGTMFQQGGGPGNQQQRSFTYGGNPPQGYQQQGYQQGYGPGFQGGYAQGNMNEDVPEHAMMLEYQRRNSEQHQRLEQQIEELLKEIRSLRQEVQQLKSK